MKFRYKVVTKGGEVIYANKVDASMGFVILECWDGELRLPSGEIAKIVKGNERLWGKFFYFLGGLFLLALLIGWVIWPNT